jgi:SET domain-containing protein
MPQCQTQLIEVKWVGRKGRGVFARRRIAKDTIIERVPVVALPVQEVFGATAKSTLSEYVFRWREGEVAIALGYGSLYNHSYEPNARFYSEGRLTQVFSALRDIDAGEEITINYLGASNNRLSFTVIDS